MNSFKVTSIDYDLGIVNVDISVDPQSIDPSLMDVEPYILSRVYNMESITPWEHAPAHMLEISIGSIVAQELTTLYPPAIPKPPALTELLNKDCVVNIAPTMTPPPPPSNPML
jgi:hypothetical protein